MARIRTIKPEFFTSIVVASVSIPAALTFSGLWTYCDDAGRAVDDARLIKAALFPLRDEVTPDVLEGYLEELAKAKLVLRYRDGARKYLCVPEDSWREHQKIDRPRASKLPEPRDSSTKVRRNNSDGDATRRRRKGKEGIGKGKGQGEGLEERAKTPGQPVDRSRYAAQERQLRMAGLPHETLALDTLVALHPHPEALILELYAVATGMHEVRGAQTGRAADISAVMRAVAEMAAVGKPFSVPLFRGFLRRIVDRPPEPPSTEHREIAKLEAEIAKRAAAEPTRGERNAEGVIVPVPIDASDSPEAREQRRIARESAMAQFHAEAGRNRSPSPLAGAAA